MLGIDNYGLFLTTSFLLAIAPGPDILYVLSRGLQGGRKSALAAAAGFSLGNIFHLFLMIIGVSALIMANPMLFKIIKYLGAAYLVYLGIQIWRSSTSDDSFTGQAIEQDKSNWQIFRQSILANMLNPKVIAFFLALFPQFVSSEVDSTWPIVILGVSFIIITWIVFSTVGIFAGLLSKLLRENSNLGATISKAAGAILILLAISLIFT